MIKKLAGLLLVVGTLGGCAVTYTYDGQRYDSKEKFQQAVDSTVSGVLATVTPLPSPLTQKKLVFAIPSEAALYAENLRRFAATNGREPNEMQKEMFLNLARSAFKSIRGFSEAIQKRNIYPSVQFVEMQAMTGSFAASADTDTLYMIEPAQGSNQWYYTSAKGGKQIFSYDRSSPTPAGKTQAFLEAVQAQAIRD